MRLYLDSMIWIYAFEGRSPFTSSAQNLFGRIERSPHTILVSHFLLAELLVVPVREKDQFTIARYRRMLLDSAATEIVPFGIEAALHFAAIRAAHRIKQPDAIHLALAASAKADAFLTADGHLSKFAIEGIDAIGDLDFKLP